MATLLTLFLLFTCFAFWDVNATTTNDKPIKLNTDTYLLVTATELKSTTEITTVIKKDKIELLEVNKLNRTHDECEGDYLLGELGLCFEKRRVNIN